MYSYDTRIGYSKIGSNRQLTLSAVVDYFQDASTLEAEDCGKNLEWMQAHHLAWIISSWEFRIMRMPSLGEKIKVATVPYEMKGFYGLRNYWLMDEQGEMLVAANSYWILMDTEKMRPCKVDEELSASFQMGEKLEYDWMSRKIPEPMEGEPFPEVKVPYYFLDTNKHMNNARYVELAMEYLPEQMREGKGFSRVRVAYKQSALLGEKIYPEVTRQGEKVVVHLKTEKNSTYAIVEFLS